MPGEGDRKGAEAQAPPAVASTGPSSRTVTFVTILGALDATLSGRTFPSSDITSALLSSWAPSTITIYRGHLSQLASTHLSLGEGIPPNQVVEVYLLHLLARGAVGSTVRGLLSAVTFAYTINLCTFQPPEAWWRLSMSAERHRLAPPRRFKCDTGCFQALAGSCSCTFHWTVLATALVALAFGLRVGESAALRTRDVTLGEQPALSFHAAKRRPGVEAWTTRGATHYVSLWLSFLCRTQPAGEDRMFPSADVLSRGWGEISMGTAA